MLRRGGPPNFLLQPDCVLLRSSQRLSGLRYCDTRLRFVLLNVNRM